MQGIVGFADFVKKNHVRLCVQCGNKKVYTGFCSLQADKSLFVGTACIAKQLCKKSTGVEEAESCLITDRTLFIEESLRLSDISKIMPVSKISPFVKKNALYCLYNAFLSENH